MTTLTLHRHAKKTMLRNHLATAGSRLGILSNSDPLALDFYTFGAPHTDLVLMF